RAAAPTLHDPSPVRVTRGSPRSPAAARGATGLLGIWLFISAFAWHHYPAQFTNTWIVGVLCAVVAAVAYWVSPVRYVNTALAVWLFISTLFLRPAGAGTLWNNVLVAIAVFAFSLAPGGAELATPRRRAPA